MKSFEDALKGAGLYPLKARSVEVLQMNLGYLCNQTCAHCHLDAGPDATEMMDSDTLSLSVEAVKKNSIPIVDITGGAPEMHPAYRWLLEALGESGARIKTRTNLTVLLERVNGDLPELWEKYGVEVIASLPCYSEPGVDAQRGKDIFKKSIEAMKMLNSAGFGPEGLGALNLVYNPGGPFLPTSEEELTADYKKALKKDHGVEFSRLFAMTNMPLGRYGEELTERGEMEEYMRLLSEGFNPEAAGSLMCATHVSVGPDGALFDCDFNQALGMELDGGKGAAHIKAFNIGELEKRKIKIGQHCYGCTAGAGSSCTGAVTQNAPSLRGV